MTVVAAVAVVRADDRLPGEPGVVLRHGRSGLRGGRGISVEALQRVRAGVPDPAVSHLGPQGLQARGERHWVNCDVFFCLRQ